MCLCDQLFGADDNTGLFMRFIDSKQGLVSVCVREIVCMCVCVCAFVCVCMCACMHACLRMRVCVCVCVHVCIKQTH